MQHWCLPKPATQHCLVIRVTLCAMTAYHANNFNELVRLAQDFVEGGEVDRYNRVNVMVAPCFTGVWQEKDCTPCVLTQAAYIMVVVPLLPQGH